MTAPRSRRSLIGTVAAVVAARVRSRSRPSRLGALAAQAREHVVTVAAFAAADLGAFEVWHHGGWFAVTVTLLALDFAVRG
jgi:hypothetical protein